MKNKIKKTLRPAVFLIRLCRDYIFDAFRFYKSCILFSSENTKEQWIAKLTIDYHRIEKGLSLPEMRPGFGTNVIHRLIHNTTHYIKVFGRDSISDIVFCVLQDYVSLNEESGIVIDEKLKAFLKSYIEQGGLKKECGGVLLVKRDEIWHLSGIDPESFFQSRYSIRHFADSEVQLSVIERAARLAKKSPSVCNRQSGRIYWTANASVIAKALAFQNGNKGFGQAVPALAVICSELDTFEKIEERNQGWIDGGLFAMSFVYGLHALGLGTCMLNWSVSAVQDIEFRKEFLIPSSQVVICMVAIGQLRDECLVAQSPRRSLSTFLHTLTPRAEIHGDAETD